MEENIIEKKKSQTGKVILVIVLLLMVALGSSFGGWYFGQKDTDKVVKQKTTQCEKELKATKETVSKDCTVEDNKQETTDSTTKCETEKPKCYGTYTEDGTEGNVKWILKDDGTYKIENQEESGAFFIKDNTVTFITLKHTTGPEDQDPYYTNPKTYLISKDCKKITFATGHTSAGLTKQD